MDPANFADHMLPKIEYTQLKAPFSYSVDSKPCYDEFCQEFIACVSGDCHAITVNDEILYNSYESKSIRETLQDDMIREKIIENPHSLFVNLFRKKENAHVIIYMLGKTPWFLAVYYHDEMRLLTLEYYKSEEYIKKWSR